MSLILRDPKSYEIPTMVIPDPRYCNPKSQILQEKEGGVVSHFFEENWLQACCQVEDPQRNCSDNQQLICNYWIILFLSLILVINRVITDNMCILVIDDKHFLSVVDADIGRFNLNESSFYF